MMASSTAPSCNACDTRDLQITRVRYAAAPQNPGHPLVAASLKVAEE